MAGRGPAPKDPSDRRRRNAPARGEHQAVAGVGWQHGEIPRPPTGLTKHSRDVWVLWMGAWWAAHWTPADLPGLELVIRLYDQVQRGDYPRATELRLAMDTYGITPKGQQDRRWKPPPAAMPEDAGPSSGQRTSSTYGHLRAVPEPAAAAPKAKRARKPPASAS
jgi:hypothetical protein